MLKSNGSYAHVFRPEVREKFVTANISTGEQLKELNEDGSHKFRNSNWGNAIFVGKECVEAASQLKDKDNIFIEDFGVRIDPYVNKDGVKMYPPKVIIFKFCMAKEQNDKFKGSKNSENNKNDDLPF